MEKLIEVILQCGFLIELNELHKILSCNVIRDGLVLEAYN